MKVREWVIGEKDSQLDSILLPLKAVPLAIRKEVRAYRKDGSWISSPDGTTYDTQPIVKADFVYHVTFMVPKEIKDIEVRAK